MLQTCFLYLLYAYLLITVRLSINDWLTSMHCQWSLSERYNHSKTDSTELLFLKLVMMTWNTLVLHHYCTHFDRQYLSDKSSIKHWRLNTCSSYTEVFCYIDFCDISSITWLSIWGFWNLHKQWQLQQWWSEPLYKACCKCVCIYQ